MDKAKILRLLDKVDDIVNALYKQGANKDYKCKMLREKLNAIKTEITAPPKSNGDRIRQMTDEELAEFMCLVKDKLCFGCSLSHVDECEGIPCRLKWLKQEVSEDAGSKTD